MQSQTFSSTTTQLEPPAFVCGLRFDEYGDLKFEDEKARQDNFAIQLSNEQLATGYIFMAAGQETFSKRGHGTPRSFQVIHGELSPSS